MFHLLYNELSLETAREIEDVCWMNFSCSRKDSSMELAVIWGTRMHSNRNAWQPPKCIQWVECTKDRFQFISILFFRFSGLQGQKVQIFRVTKFWTSLHKSGNISESLNIWWRIHIDEMWFIDWCWTGIIWFFIFKKMYVVLRWGQSLGTNLGFLESVQNRYFAKILESFMCNYTISFNVQIIWVYSVIKIT